MVAGCRSLPPTPPEGKGELWAAIFFIATCCDIFYGVSHILYCVCFEPSERR